jgi:hypothetical protein
MCLDRTGVSPDAAIGSHLLNPGNWADRHDRRPRHGSNAAKPARRLDEHAHHSTHAASAGCTIDWPAP